RDHYDKASLVLRSFPVLYSPRRAICRRSIVATVVAILDPLKDVPDHVVEAKSIRCERTDRRRLLVIPLAPATVALAILLVKCLMGRIVRRDLVLVQNPICEELAVHLVTT